MEFPNLYGYANASLWVWFAIILWSRGFYKESLMLFTTATLLIYSWRLLRCHYLQKLEEAEKRAFRQGGDAMAQIIHREIVDVPQQIRSKIASILLQGVHKA